jgi:hypothetical protein
MLWSGTEAVDVLHFALAAYASNAGGAVGGTQHRSSSSQVSRSHLRGEQPRFSKIDIPAIAAMPIAAKLDRIGALNFARR